MDLKKNIYISKFIFSIHRTPLMQLKNKSKIYFESFGLMRQKFRLASHRPILFIIGDDVLQELFQSWREGEKKKLIFITIFANVSQLYCLWMFQDLSENKTLHRVINSFRF